MLEVRDIMTRDIVSVTSDAPLQVVAWRLSFEAVSGAPVRDPHGNLVGVITKSDLIDPARVHDDGEHVVDAMTHGVLAVSPDTPVLEAVQLMLDKGIHRVFVLDGPGQMVGLVTTIDVLRALVDGHFVESPGAVLRLRREADEEQVDEDEEEAGEAVDIRDAAASDAER